MQQKHKGEGFQSSAGSERSEGNDTVNKFSFLHHVKTNSVTTWLSLLLKRRGWSKEEWQQMSLRNACYNPSDTRHRWLFHLHLYKLKVTIYSERQTFLHIASRLTSRCKPGAFLENTSEFHWESRGFWCLHPSRMSHRWIWQLFAPDKIKSGNWTCCLFTQPVLELEPMGSIESRFSKWVKKRTFHQPD